MSTTTDGSEKPHAWRVTTTDEEEALRAARAKQPRPLHDRLLVKRVKEGEKVTAAGIVLPEVAVEQPQEGDVVAVGRGRLENGVRVPLDVVVGDRVLFGKYSGSDVKIRGEEFLILREDEVMAVV